MLTLNKSRYASRDESFPILMYPRWFLSGRIVYLYNLSEAGSCILLSTASSLLLLSELVASWGAQHPHEIESAGLWGGAEFGWKLKNKQTKNTREWLGSVLFHQGIAMLILAKLSLAGVCGRAGSSSLNPSTLYKATSRAVISLSLLSFLRSGAPWGKK